MNKRHIAFIILLTFGFVLLIYLQVRSAMNLIQIDNSIKSDNIDRVMIKVIDGFSTDRGGWITKLNEHPEDDYDDEIAKNCRKEVDSIIEDGFSMLNFETNVEYIICCRKGKYIFFKSDNSDLYAEELKNTEFRYPIADFGRLFSDNLEIALYFPNNSLTFIGSAKDIWNSDIRNGFIAQIIMMVLYLWIFVLVLLHWLKIFMIDKESKTYIERISHEYNTPVATILLATELLQDKNIETDEELRKTYLNTISDEAQSLKLLTGQILMAGSLDRNLLFTPTKDVDVHQVLSLCVKSRTLVIQDKKGKIDMELEATNHIVRANIMLDTVFSSIIDNAIKYSKEVPEISIKTCNIGSRKIRITISDKGVGMSKRDVRNAFRKYYRGSHANIKGFGLGLYNTNKIIKRFHGSAIIQSELGIGTTIIITLNCK